MEKLKVSAKKLQSPNCKECVHYNVTKFLTPSLNVSETQCNQYDCIHKYQYKDRFKKKKEIKEK